MHYRRSWVSVLLGSLAGWGALFCAVGAVMAGAGYEFGPAAEQVAVLELQVRDVSDVAGRGLPARVRVVRLFAREAKRVSVLAEGRQTLRLAPGEYRVTASHGPEWSVAQVHLSLGAGERRSVVLSLERQVSSGRYLGCDLHVHSEGSPDSRVALGERSASAAAEGLHTAVITDHNRATDLAGFVQGAGAMLVRGVEVTTWEPEFGHFNVFPSALAPPYKRSNPERLLSALPVNSGRFVQVNHPRLMRHIGYFELAGPRGRQTVLHAMRHGFDGLEVWNGYDLHRPAARDRVLADWLGLIRSGRRVVATGSSDSHDLVRTLIGYPRTYVALQAAPAPDGLPLAAALRAGRAFVSNGPVLELSVGGRGPGETLGVARGPALVPVRLRVDAPAWMDLASVELWVDGRRALVQGLAPFSQPQKLPDVARAELAWDLPLGRARSVLAVVRGTRAMTELFDERQVLPFAFTNPVWLVQR